jgi:hypothetical protein
LPDKRRRVSRWVLHQLQSHHILHEAFFVLLIYLY